MILQKLKLYLLALIPLATPAFFTTKALADSVSGFVQRVDSGFCLAKTQSFTNCQAMRALNQDAQQALSTLNTGDYLVGSGSLINSVIVLDQVEFVGLRALLGVWKSGESLMRFQNFSTVTTYMISTKGLAPDSRLQYSISPNTANSWRLFFTGSDNVLPAMLTLQGPSSAVLEFIDADSGAISASYSLQKIISY